MRITNLTYVFITIVIMALLSSCGGDKKEMTDNSEKANKPRAKSMLKKKLKPMDDPGIGPIKELTFPVEINQSMVENGKKIYKEKCTVCHKESEKFIGPSPKGIFDRRNPAWVMNMILNPDEMVKKNAIAKKLLKEYNNSPMTNQNLKESEARDIVEYFRTIK